MRTKMILVAIFATTVLVSCKTSQQKENAAQQNVTEAKQDLRTVEVSNASDWKVFKAESEAKIVENDAKIAELKVKMNQPGNTFDGIYRTRIEKLEAKSAELKTQLNGYDGNPSTWETFKGDFNRGMNEVGGNIKDLFR